MEEKFGLWILLNKSNEEYFFSITCREPKQEEIAIYNIIDLKKYLSKEFLEKLIKEY